MTDPKNGAAPPSNPLGLDDAQVAQVRAMAMEQNVGMILMLLQALAPKIPPVKLEGIIRGICKQQEHEDFTRILDDATDPKKRESHPVWGVQLWAHGKPRKGNPLLLLRAPKDPTKLGSGDEALQYVTILGLVTNPTTRAMLLALGYEAHFFETKASALVTL